MSPTLMPTKQEWPVLNTGAIATLVALIENGPLTPQELPSKAGRTQLQALGYCAIIVEDQVAHRYAATALGSIAYKYLFGNTDYLAEAIAYRQANALISKMIRK